MAPNASMDPEAHLLQGSKRNVFSLNKSRHLATHIHICTALVCMGDNTHDPESRGKSVHVVFSASHEINAI